MYIHHNTKIKLLAGLSLGCWASIAMAERPAFEAPFPCGQTWRASTYEGHGSDAIDIVQRNDSLTIVGEYQPALASAAGVVSFDHTWPSGSKRGERWVIVDHNDGWRTHYFHLEAEEGKPRLAIGRKVAKGEVLGRTSNSGATSVHIHYAQMKNTARSADNLNSLADTSVDNWGKVLSDGTKTRIRFRGKKIDTYLANEDSWNTFSNDKSEKITSTNCMGSKFATWTNGGKHFIMRYKPSSGGIRVNQLHPEDGDNPLLFDTNLGLGWNNIVPFYSAANNQPHLMLYDFANGNLTFRRVHPDNAGTDFLKSFKIYKGWTHFIPAYVNGKPFMVAYDSRYGHFNVDKLTPTNDGLQNMLKTNIGKGYTHINYFEDGPRRFLHLYKGGSGEMKIVQLTKNGSGESESMKVDTTWTAQRREGWTHLAPLIRDGQNYLFGYDDIDGSAKVWQFKSKGEGLDGVKNLNWTPGYTAITPYSKGGKGHLLVYDMADGRTRKLRLKNDISGFKNVMRGNWEGGFQ